MRKKMKAIHSLILILCAILFLSFAEAKTTRVPARAAKASSVKRFVPGKAAYAKASKTALNPRPDSSVRTILPLAKFLKLSRENQEIYLIGLQRLMLSLEKSDEALHTRYQSAQASPYLDWLLPTADAGEDDRRCVYAGWISEMDINGKYCMTPPGHCPVQGQVPCNPLLYGKNKCVPANRGATASCERSKKSPADVAADIRAKGNDALQEWSTMRSDLESYCSDPRPSQTKVCAMVSSQLARLDRVIGEVPPAQYDASADGSKTSDARPASSADAEGSGADESAGDVVVVQPAPKASSSSAPARAPALSLTRASGNCAPATLVANLRPESLSGISSYNFMDLESARTLMCSTEAIPGDWLNGRRNAIKDAEARIRGTDKYARADRRNYEGILANFNACVRDAETLRRTGAGAVSGDYATLIQDGAFVKMYDESNRPIVGLGSVYDLEGLLRAKGISICNLQTRDGVQLAPVYSNGAGTMAAPSGSAQ